MKRIGIDARIYGPAFTEIGIYTQHLLEELAKLAPSDITFVVFAAEVHRREIESLGENFEFVPVCVLQYSFAEQITFPITLKKARLDLMHFVHFNTPLLYRGRSVVTIHDLILSLYPGKSVGSWFQRFAYTLTLKNIVRRAASIITVSHHTKRDLIELMQIDESSIVPIHNWGNNDCARVFLNQEIIDMNLSLKLNIPQYILSLGVIQEHKNIVRLIDGFKLMIDAWYTGNLVLAGKEDSRYTEPRDRVRELGLQSRVQFMGQVSPAERIYLLQETELFAMPSLYEGFGIPILEALTAGTPVIASNSSSLPEIGGEAVQYFHPLRSDDLARVALEVLSSSSLQAEMKSAGYVQATKFSWENTSKETLAVYKKILAK